MRYLSLFVTILVLSSCKPWILPGAKYNRVITEYSSYLLNDSLQISMSFPADIDFYTDSARLRLSKIETKKFRNIQKIKKGSIISFGKTNFPPGYEFVIATAKGPTDSLTRIENDSSVLITAPLSSSKKLMIVGTAEGNPRNMIVDLSKALGSLKYDSNYTPLVPQSPVSILQEGLGKITPDSYLSTLKRLQYRRKNYTTDDEIGIYNQMYMTAASMVLGYPGFDSLERMYENRRKIDLSLLDNDSIKKYTDEQALSAIKRIADTSKVVMFNELHWDRRHRMQVIELLQVFKDAGYTHLGLEAFSDTDSLAKMKGYPSDSNGFYVKEPSLAHLIREAYKSGFEVFGYDAGGSKEREKEQARNIYEQSLINNADAKVLIHAGVGHIHEKRDGNRKMMAAEFLDLTGINPTTIDQMYIGMSIGESRYERLLVSQKDYAKVLPIRIDTDFYLGTKKSQDPIFQAGELVRVKIDTTGLTLYPDEQYYSQLYYQEEFDQREFAAIPLYNHLGIRTNYNLSPGKYHWLVSNAQGDLMLEKSLSIKRD
jgi:hypothetical protein